MAKSKKLEQLYKLLVVDGGGRSPYRYRIAITFREKLDNYFTLVETESKTTAFYTAFVMDARARFLTAVVNEIAAGTYGTARNGELNFQELMAPIPSTVTVNNSGKTMNSVDANNAFNAWYGVKKPTLMKGVGFVRFAGFIWHIFWDEEFQNWCRVISTI